MAPNPTQDCNRFGRRGSRGVRERRFSVDGLQQGFNLLKLLLGPPDGDAHASLRAADASGPNGHCVNAAQDVECLDLGEYLPVHGPERAS